MKPLGPGLLAVLTLGGCVTPLSPDLEPWRNLEPSPRHLAFITEEGQASSRHGGEVPYRIYRPELAGLGEAERRALEARPVILLAHGFLRSREAMAGWGAHLAAAGWTVLTPSFRHSSLLGGNHDKNADDLRDLAAQGFPGRGRIYGGFSAGGLAALLAGAADGETQALFGLDPVDSGGLAGGALALNRLQSLPGLFLFGDPSSCNADNNLKGPLNAAAGPAWTLTAVQGATHGVFEAPYDPGTEGLCGSYADPAAPDLYGRWLRARVTAWLEALAPVPIPERD